MADAPPPPPAAAHRGHLDSPVDLDGSTHVGGQPLIWTTTVIAAAAGFLLLTNALALDGWAAELAPSETVARLNRATAAWKQATDAVGLGATRAAMHRRWQAAQRARFAGQKGAEE